ncbi:MAG TPA: PBP1A family penicillin-binding protein, partial [Polyangia bacterium]|nr:PBP1A family penicillin-binding protein [Polyangia bacterium]
VVGLFGMFLVLSADPDLPKIDAVSDYRPKVVSKVMSADGELIGEIYEERRTVVGRDKIPPVMIHAIVDAEDAQFYEHGGISYWGIFRALVDDLKPGAHVRGASTLTQQLVRNLILKNFTRSGFAGVKRKAQEMILAKRLESKLSKDEILYLYLNQIEFPYQRFGVEEAARFYFGKSISEVDAGEAALLASLPKGPSEIDPWKHADRAKERQRYVLSQMVRYQHLKPEEAERFARMPIRLVKLSTTAVGTAPEFVDEVRKVLVEKFGAKRLATLGLTIVTTCDARVQKLAREAVDKGLVDLDARQGYRKPLAHLTGKALEQHLRKLARDNPDGPSRDKIVEGVVARVDADGAEIALSTAFEERVRAVDPKKGAHEIVHQYVERKGWLPLPTAIDRYNPKALPPEKRFSVGDVLRVRVIDYPKDKPALLALELGPQAAVVVLDPNTREVKALVGGYGYRPGGFDRALSAKRQPGSSFKPFVYTAAFATEKWTPASVLIDGPQTYVSPGLAPWKPQNAEKEEFLGPVRLRVALARSLNTVASQLVDTSRGGVDPVVVASLAHDLGIESNLEANPSLALGTSVVSPFEMTNAYATFAAGGKRMAPQLIKKIGGEDYPPPSAQAAQALKPELAYLITDVMRSVIEEGTAASARGKLGRPAAGKTGTTNLDKKRPDAWFMGFTPNLVTGVWVGFDDMHDLGRGEQGARAALPMWVEIMQGALKGVPPQPFTQPPGIVVQKIDPKTGLLAPPGAQSIDEVFLEGTAPTQVAPAAGEANPDTFITDQAQ